MAFLVGPRTLGCLARCFYAVLLSAGVQSSPTPSLEAFFQSLTQHYDPANLPAFESLLAVQRQVAKMDPGDVSKALPFVASAFAHHDDTVKKYAAAALFSIGMRSDGSALLKPYSRTIAGGLDSPEIHLQGATVQLLAILKPEPKSEEISLLVGFVNRVDRNPTAQADAISLLLQIAPEDPTLTPAIQNFMARPMNEQSKEAVVNGIANSHTESVIATEVLIGALENSSEGVRLQAAQAFQRMPKDAVLRAKAALRRVADREDEREEVKAAAQEALQRLDQ